MINIDQVIEKAIEKDASDIHWISGLKPMLRITRSLVELEGSQVLNYLADLPFYVIATSVSVRENAERALRELRQKGYPAVYAGYQNGLYLIAYRGFRSRSEAMKFFEEILNTTDNTQVWVKVYNRNADKKTD